MRGKEKCKALKEIRQKIAEQNDIAFAVSECTHQGDCKGTCPKCEAELRYLERQLEIRRNLGKAVAVAGISVGMCAPLTACNPIEAIGDVIADVYYSINPPEDIAGDVQYIPPEQQLTGDVYIPEDIDGGIEELELTGEETWNPDLEEPSEEDSDALLPSEEDSEELAGDVEYDPSWEENSSENDSSEEDLEDLDAQILEGDIAIDPEFLDEE